jgi:hypothetical protein
LCPPFQVRYTTTLLSLPSQASIPVTRSSQLPVGGLHSAFNALAGGDVFFGWPFFLPLFVPFVASVPVLALPRFFLFFALSFFSCQAARIASLPPTLARYSSRTSDAVSLQRHISQAILSRRGVATTNSLLAPRCGLTLCHSLPI